MHARTIVGFMLALGLVAGLPSFAQAGEPPAPDQPQQENTVGRTPPRLSFVDAQASFWRPGAQEWVQAQLNTPLAPGDQLYTGSPGNLELQIGSRAFVRAWANTQIGLENQEPDFIQFKVTAGRASFDLRTLEPGNTVEVDTPNGAFTIEHPGYYRVNVIGDRTSFITRRAGRAIVTPANGEAVAIAASEEVVVEGTDNPSVSSFVAPKLDDWDKWNYARTDALLDAVSARYVPSGTYGVDDLDHHGAWRVVDTYGPVWVPTSVPSGWAPYTTGSWMLDPFYGWTWVDTAPWGWAPYHYGRWVFVNNYWGWAPGPVVARPVYAPALVAFFGGPGVGVSISVGGPVVGWVALGWGEPCVPWWGRPGFIHRPWWGGWGGPRVVNNVVIQRTTVVNVEQINIYRNAHVHNGVVAVDERRFGHGRVAPVRVADGDLPHFRPIHAAPNVSPTAASFVPTANRGIRPPERDLQRPVVATRPPHRGEGPAGGGERRVGPEGVPEPAPRLVTAPQPREPAAVLSRPPFGRSTIERPAPERPRPPARQKPESARSVERGMETPAQPQPASKGTTSLPPSRPESKVTAPSPGVPTAPTQTPEVSRPSGERGQAPPSSRSDVRGRPKQGGEDRQPATRPQAAQGKPGSTVAMPPPSHPAAARHEVSPPQARQLPGEPANRLAPHRAEKSPPGRVERDAPSPQPHGEGGPPARERSGGRP